MIVENVLIRPHGINEISISWTSENEEMLSYIFVNAKPVVSAFRAETKNRTVVLPVSSDKTFKIEVHDFDNDYEIPDSIEEPPHVKPVLSWNNVENAVAYKIYHTIFDTGTIESLLARVPARSINRTEIDCHVKLEGKSGRWHHFRIETVDQYGQESVNEIVPFFAADLPHVPKLMISRNIETELFSFRIV